MRRRDWSREFEIAPGVVFLDHAAFGPVPRRGRRAVEALLRRQGQLSDDPNVDDESFSLLVDAKRGFARLVGQDARRVAFAPNTSFGINSILWGLGLRRGERILIYENEFPALVYAVRNLAARLDLVVDPLPGADGFLSLETLRKSLRRKAAALVISWVQYFNGYRYDLAALTRLCHAHGCFVLVDGMQGVGAVPLNMRQAGIDALACGAQKWLFGQTGAGFFSIAADPIRPVAPLYACWLGYDWRYRFGNLLRWDRPAYRDGRFWEIGTYPYYSVRLAAAGVGLINEFGIGQVHLRITGLLDRLADGLLNTRYAAETFPDPANRSGIVAVRGPRAAALRRHLKQRRIHVSLREGNIRVSPHFYNREDHIDTLVEETWRFSRTR